MCADWRKHGREVIAKCREKHPDVYLRVIASLEPREVHAEITTSHEQNVTLLTERLARLDAGLTIEPVDYVPCPLLPAPALNDKDVT
jgi:hypothetical protein